MQEPWPDAYLTDEQKDAQKRIEFLKNQAEKGALFADWMRAAPTVLFLHMLENQIADAKNSWLAAKDRDAAEIVRIQSQVYVKIKQWIVSQVQAGRVAETGLKQFEEEGEALSNVVRAPQENES